MKQFALLILAVVCFGLVGCSPSARSRSAKSFDEIRAMVAGKTEAEVEKLLGDPDRREKLLIGDERWIWWNYTYLEGRDWAPEIRGKVVHLEITFAEPLIAAMRGDEPSRWRVGEPYGVGFSLPGSAQP